MIINKRKEKYKRLVQQIETLITDEQDVISRMATINAVLYHKMQDFFWVGFYLLKDDVLTVGPYQGPLACIVLKKNKGVCWSCILTQKTLIVPDVDKFPGHISCDTGSRSEITVPLRNTSGEITGVLDIDSNKVSCFNETDAACLEEIAAIVYGKD